ncbi:MAG: type I secretion C-terminal target domain-containing protein [Sphingobium sp.]
MATGPSSSLSPYLLGAEPNVHFTSIITVGDPLSPGGTTGIFGGIPDGMGAFDNGDGTITVIMNHELSAGVGVVRDHGTTGAYIDRLVIDKNTLAVVSGDDAVQTVNTWDDVNDVYVTGPAEFSRFCSGDLAAPSAFYDATSGLGTQTRIFLTGEENGPEGRATGTIVSGDESGTLYELPFLGNMSFENIVANPYAQTKTIVAATDDTGGGQVYIYVGEKQASGSDIDKAGLSGGSFYGIKVDGLLSEVDGAPATGAFTLQEIGPDGDVSNMTGAEIDAESTAEGVTGFLRPEDAAWDPDNPNVLYFTTTASFDGNSRLYKLTFSDVSNPEAGGTIEAVLDGSEGQHMLDNMSFGQGVAMLQEDPGSASYLAGIFEYDGATDMLHRMADFDPAQFTPGAPGFITSNEESSGIIDVTDLLGDADTRAYLLDAQVHASTGDPATVEYGQLLAMFVEEAQTRGDDGNDTLNGSYADETFFGYEGNDTINAGSGDDNVHAGEGNDTVNAGAGNDNVRGDAGNDTLNGGAGKDKLVGGEGNDVLDGGADRDGLTGGAGADLFVFSSATDSVKGAQDFITDFNAAEGDRIDLSGVDAIAGGSDDAFTMVSAFTGVAGELTTVYNANVNATFVYGDTDGDGAADFAFTLKNTSSVSASDFIL